jgi:hypothetical protein
MVPEMLTGFLMSKCGAKLWWACTATGMRAALSKVAARTRKLRINGMVCPLLFSVFV